MQVSGPFFLVAVTRSCSPAINTANYAPLRAAPISALLDARLHIAAFLASLLGACGPDGPDQCYGGPGECPGNDGGPPGNDWANGRIFADAHVADAGAPREAAVRDARRGRRYQEQRYACER